MLARQRKNWSHHLLLGVRCYSHLEKQWQFHDSYFSHVFVFRLKKQRYVSTQRLTPVFRAGLLVMAPEWKKKLIVPSTGELIHGLWCYPSDGGCCLALKRKEPLLCATLWMNLNMVMPSGKAKQRRVYTLWIHIYTVLDSTFLAVVRERSSAVSWGYDRGEGSWGVGEGLHIDMRRLWSGGGYA